MAFVPKTGPIKMTDIRNARNSDGSAGTTSTTFSVLRDGAVFSKFDPFYLGSVGSLNDVTRFYQFRNYPNNTVTLYQTDFACFGIANNQTLTYPLLSPVQLLCGYIEVNDDGKIYRSTDFGLNYSIVLTINQRLYKIKFLPDFRHASYLSVPPFVAVGEGGRIVTNSVTNCTSFITVGAPTSQDLFDIAFNSTQAIIVGDARILKTGTANRISSWTVVNSNSNIWRSVASNGSIFVAVGDNGSIITGDSAGTTWTPRSMPPLSPSNISLRGITYHSDGYFYAVGFTAFLEPFIMRSSNNGVNWELFTTNLTGDTILNPLYSIESINNKLYIGGTNAQYEIDNLEVRRFTADFTTQNDTRWRAIVKSDNSNGFHMAGTVGPYEFTSVYGGYSIF